MCTVKFIKCLNSLTDANTNFRKKQIPSKEYAFKCYFSKDIMMFQEYSIILYAFLKTSH